MLAGTIVAIATGGPKRRVHGIVACMIAEGLFIALGGIRPSLWLFGIAAFGFFLFLPIDNASTRTLLQRKVAPEVRGRVFSVAVMIAHAAMPAGYLAAGPLADYVFKPLLEPSGALAGTLGHFVGVGQGRGIGLMFILAGGLYAALALAMYTRPRFRNLESELPDAT
jgi:DHA3 family macrolide efflux protein-like MFS transporter